MNRRNAKGEIEKRKGEGKRMKSVKRKTRGKKSKGGVSNQGQRITKQDISW